LVVMINVSSRRGQAAVPLVTAPVPVYPLANDD
jgi:hypothetical protein